VAAPEGREKFFAAVGGCLAEACSQAGLDYKTIIFSAAGLGFSGGAADKDAYARELIRATDYKITHDAEIALMGATAGQPGIIIIAGTGSMAFGRNARGKTARAGGWGYVFGDEGGGFDLTRRALRAALRHEERWGPPTSLHALLLEATRAANANDLLHRFYTSEFSRSKIASFSPLVTRAAEDGDEIALNILKEAAAELSWYVEGLYHHLFPDSEHAFVSHVGGVFQSFPLRVEFTSLIHLRTQCQTGAPRYNPAAGAVLEALRLDGNLSDLSDVPDSDK
jgi:N-acetylglucosamine kinase-like BadF-type ATPase